MPLFVPGGQPPFLVPYCQLCGLPVELFTFMPIKSEFYLEVEAQCCNKTQGMRLSREDAIRLKRSNEKLFLVVKTRRTQGVYPMRRAF